MAVADRVTGSKCAAPLFFLPREALRRFRPGNLVMCWMPRAVEPQAIRL
jgi:hypothetical protein